MISAIASSKMPRNTIAFALFVGIVTGICDALVLQLNLFGSRVVPYLQPSLWILVPAVWAIFCGAVAVIFLPRLIRRFTVAAVVLAGPGLLLLSRLGSFLKRSAGFSVVTSSFVCITAAAFIALLVARVSRNLDLKLNRGAAWIAVLMVLPLLLAATPIRRTERRTIAPTSVRIMRPNVLLIFLDTVRSDDARQMPNLAKFAATSVSFENAWSPAPWTLPSHFSVFTGVDQWSVDFDEKTQSFQYQGAPLARIFSAHGYTSAAIFANPLLTPGTGLSRGFQDFDYSRSCAACRSGLAWLLDHAYTYAGRRSPICSVFTASKVTGDAVHFVRNAQRPYFLTLNFMDAHDPYVVEPDCRDKSFHSYTMSDWTLFTSVSPRGSQLAPHLVSTIHNQYRSALRCLDHSLGVLFNDLQQQSDYDRTIVVIVGDHGEQFGEHGLYFHGNSLYAPVLRVPLVVKPANRNTAQRVTNPVSITDIYWTLLQLTGLARQPRGLFTADRHIVAARFETVAGLGAKSSSAYSIIGSKYHLIRSEDGREEIYDYSSDPAEKQALTSTNGVPAIDDLRASSLKLFTTAQRRQAALFSLDYLQ